MIGYGSCNAGLDIGTFGLLSSFPIVYFVGLFVLSLSFLISVKNNQWWFSLVQTVLLIISLWLIPATVGSHPGMAMAYRNLFHIQGIAANGLGSVLDSSFHYLSWAGFQVFYGILVKIFHFNLESILWVYPFIMQMLFMVPLYVFFRNVVSDKRFIWLGLWLLMGQVFSVFNVLLLFYYRI